MTDDSSAEPDREKGIPSGEIPTHIISLRSERESGPDQIAPLAVLAMLVALLGTTCMPLWTVITIMASGHAVQLETQGGDAAGTTTQQAIAPPDVPTIALGLVLVFFLIAVLGMIGGFGTLLRRQWGRRLLMTYAALVLLYLVAAVFLRLRFGIEGMTETAPTASALSLNFTCVFGVLLLVGTLMIMILRYFTQPHIVARFH